MMSAPTKDTEETTEFYVPSLGFAVEPYIETGDMQGTHHIARYQWAAMALNDLRPMRVVDIACGAGYGSHMLAKALPGSEIVGVDYDPRAVEHAVTNFSSPNLSYRTGSIVDFGDIGACDAIVSFDTIEHILHREIALESIANTLNANGALLLSTPCSHEETRLNPGWEHHKIEFSHKDLFRFLSRYFRKIVKPQDALFPRYDFWTDVINSGKVRYPNLMNPVVCLDPIPSPSYNS